MPAKVTLTVTKGRLLGQSFEFDYRTTCLMGRASDCQPQLPDDEDHNTISRYHCLLDINPPAARIRDFGSLNGTYVNGTKIGQREPHQTPQEAAQINFPEYDLKAGDTIKLGKTVFAVGVEADQEVTPVGFEPPTIDLLDLAQPDALNSINQILAQEDESSGLRNYKLISELGRGGFGAVYLALNQKTGEQVALKVMLPKTKVTQRGINDFLREMHNTQALSHPHVVKLLEYDCFGSTFFFTLEYCEGGSVDKLAHQQGGCLSIDQSISIILQVLDGLDYSHQAPMPEVILPDGSLGTGTGLVHRDLKPANIFLTGKGSNQIAKVGDYGLSKAFDQAGLSGQTMSGTTAGTPHFMPRQQVINFKYAKPEVDVWAAAASLYNLLTGAVPRDFKRGADPFLVVLRSDCVPIRQRLSTIPAKLADVIDTALIDNPEIGFKTALEFKRALLEVM